MEFAYIDEIKWTEETLSQNIAKKIYKFPKEIMPHYYQFSFSVEEYRRFRETELGLKAIDLWQNELLQCLSILKDWANTQDIKIFDEHRQLVSASNLLSRFFDRLKNDEFSDKTALFYADGKKAIGIIALLIQDENIDLAFRQNQLVALTTDGNLMHCADGCVAR